MREMLPSLVSPVQPPYNLLKMGGFVQQDAAKLLAALGTDPATVVAAAAAAKAKAAPKTPEAAPPAAAPAAPPKLPHVPTQGWPGAYAVPAPSLSRGSFLWRASLAPLILRGAVRRAIWEAV